MRKRYIVAAALCTAMSSAIAQKSGIRYELRPVAAWYVPTGSQGDDFKSAATYGLQVAAELSSAFHILASGSWMDGRSKIPALFEEKLTMWQYDAGVEVNNVQELPSAWLLRPFAGLGLGARTYDYKQTGMPTSTCSTGYAALGTEFQKSVLALRFESRGYVSCFKQPYTGRSLNRADVSFAFGLAYHVN